MINKNSFVKGVAIGSLLLFGVTTYNSANKNVTNPLVTVVHADANTGAIWTTDVACGGININLFANKSDVYLNGGPNGNGQGLADGNYFVKVTDPSGATLLGHVSASGAVHVTDGHFDACYNLYSLTAFDDTPNNGDEYKVWVSQDSEFGNGDNKTDNFKVGSESPSPSPSPSTEPSVSPSPSASVSPSPSPSVSPSPSPSVAPSNPPSSDNPSNNDTPSTPSTPENAQGGAVLGAYAGTGVVEDVIMNALGSVGGLMTMAGSVLYGKKRLQK